MLKRSFCILLLITMVFSFVACAKEEPKDTTSEPTTASDTKPASTVEPTASKDEVVTVTFETCQYLEAPHKLALDAILEEFNTLNPNIKIEYFGTDFANYWTSLTTEVMAGNQGDIVQFHPTHLSRYHFLQEGGTFVNLNDKIKGTKWEEILTMQSTDTLIDGDYYAMCCYAWGTLGIFYRKSLFEAEGIDPSTIKDVASFEKVLDKFSKKDGVRGLAAVTGTHAFVTTEWHRFIARPASGGIYFANGEAGPYVKSNVNTNNPGNVWAAQLWQKWLMDDKLTSAKDKAEARELFWNGYVAMNLDGPWFVGMTREKSTEVYNDLGAIPLITIEYNGKSNKPSPTVTPLICAISKKCENFEAAWKFLEYMASEDGGQKHAAMCGMIPCNIEYVNNSDYKTEHEMEYSFSKFLSDYYDTPLHDPYIGEQGSMEQIMIDAAQKMFASYQDCEKVLNEAAEKIKELFPN